MTATFHADLPADFDPTAPWSFPCPEPRCGVEMWGESAEAAEQNAREHQRIHHPHPEVGQRVVLHHGGHVSFEGLVEAVEADERGFLRVHAITDSGVRFACFPEQCEPVPSRQERLAQQIYSEAMAQLLELSDESGEFLEEPADEELAEDLRGCLAAALDQRYSDWCADNGIGQ